MRALKHSIILLGVGFITGVIVAMNSMSWLYQVEMDHHPDVTPREYSGRHKIENCVCGNILDRLKKLSRIALHSNHDVNSTQMSPEDEKHLKEFLYPHNNTPILTYRDMKKNQYRPGSRSEPITLREEYLFKKSILVGVLTQQEYLHTRAKYLYDTWGKEVDKIIFFVGEDCNISSDLSYLPIVKLKGIADRVYPPLKKTFAVLKYMYDHHIDQFNWFIRADDDMYMRVNKLKELLVQMHPYEDVYLGRAGTGRKDDLKRLRLLSHERYCMGGPGIILSVTTLRGVGPHLNNCLAAVLQYSPTDYNDDDVEVGRCISRKIDVQCSSSTQSRRLFIFDYDAASLNPVTLWTTPYLQELITVHPVKQPDNMLSLHHFYKTLEFGNTYKRVSELANYLNSLCGSFPEHVTPPLSVSAGCDLKLHPHLAYFNTSSKMNHQGLSPGSYLVERDRVPFLLKSVNKFDLHVWARFNDSTVQEMNAMFPQHSPQGSLKAEVRHVLGMLKSHIRNEYKSNAVKIRHILDGYVRFNPHLGREYILTLKLSMGRSEPLYKRYHVVREIGPLMTVVESQMTSSSSTVNIILPLHQVDQRFYEFLRSYGQFGLKYKENSVHLVVVVFSQETANLVEDALNEFTEDTYSASVSIVTGHGIYHFLRGLDLGVASLKEDDGGIVFLADVSTRFGSGFFRRCRSNPQLGKRVYFPYPFSLYRFDTSAFSEGRTPDITPWKGQWDVPNFWMACIYKHDYDALGGYRDKKYSVDLFNTVLSSSLDVLRAPEPGLFRTWSSKECRTLSSSRRRNICLEMKKAGNYPWADLANYLGEMDSNEGNFLVAKDIAL